MNPPFIGSNVNGKNIVVCIQEAGAGSSSVHFPLETA